MKVLTIRQPWAGLIALGVKDVENRSWRPSDDMIGQRFAVHGGRWDDLDSAQLELLDSSGVDMGQAACISRGFLICTVRLVDVTRDYPSRWAATGAWHWVLEDPRRVRDERRLRGQQGFWTA